ncbi:hypothetical protein DNI29_04480 [Hymenobacter sediminis]|uniref:hypothetical protein n=1 Tax=Hymenobacter sediminis TaxID=2218621 RepID=UPI000DA6AA5B|nr:hypothetical protein [Hymenobacter sediminis]RPD50059.1 hypothetical protein DNI29_04480 [Hymenobacter sediminis]
MKKTILPFVSAILLSSGFLTSCDKDDEPQKKTAAPASHTVEVRYQGANLTGLEATLRGGSSLPDGTQEKNGISLDLTGSPSGTASAGVVTTDRDFYMTATFYAIKPGKTIPSNAYLSFDVYVDGVKARSTRLDNTNKETTFPKARVAIYSREW